MAPDGWVEPSLDLLQYLRKMYEETEEGEAKVALKNTINVHIIALIKEEVNRNFAVFIPDYTIKEIKMILGDWKYGS